MVPGHTTVADLGDAEWQATFRNLTSEQRETLVTAWQAAVEKIEHLTPRVYCV